MTDELDQDDLDEDGYPSDFALAKIESFSYEKDYNDLMQYIKSIWWMPTFGWRQSEPTVEICASLDGKNKITKTLYTISTGGWSGNESIIHSLTQNKLFWSTSWVSSRRGGHYELEIKDVERIE